MRQVLPPRNFPQCSRNRMDWDSAYGTTVKDGDTRRLIGERSPWKFEKLEG